MSGRSLRARVAVSSESWQAVVSRGYAAFPAQPGGENDGDQDCTAALSYLPGPDGNAIWIVGSTGQGAGHAEMHALSQFVANVCDHKVETFADYLNGRVTVWCESKPCCLYCSAVMGLLQIGPENGKTKKSDRRMGGTQWAISPALRSFISRFTGVPDNTLAAFDST